MLTTEKERETLRSDLQLLPGVEILRHVLADLDRLAALERTTGGLTAYERETFQFSASQGVISSSIALRLDDALRATTAELERARGMLVSIVGDLCGRASGACGGNCGGEECVVAMDARAYLAETEVNLLDVRTELKHFSQASLPPKEEETP